MESELGSCLAGCWPGLEPGGGPVSAQSVLEKAKREGKVVWYVAMNRTIAQRVCERFNQKDMGIKCEMFRHSTGKLYRRYLQEARAGIYVGDVLHTGNPGQFLALKSSKQIVQYTPKGFDRFPKDFRDKDGYYFVLRAGLFAPAYNTTKISPAEAPKRWKDFLNPKWTGKVVIAHPAMSGSIATGVAALVEKYGWKYFKEFAKVKPRIVNQATSASQFVANGENSLSLGGNDYNHFVLLKKGAPIGILLMEDGVPIIRNNSAIFAKAPHPNAAKVFVDYLFSLEAQQILTDAGLYVGHPDVKYPPGKKPLGELNLLRVPDEKFLQLRKTIKKKFREFFGV